jgi:hypothetical protein
MKASRVTVPYLSELTGIGESTIWNNIRLLQPLVQSDVHPEDQPH